MFLRIMHLCADSYSARNYVVYNLQNFFSVQKVFDPRRMQLIICNIIKLRTRFLCKNCTLQTLQIVSLWLRCWLMSVKSQRISFIFFLSIKKYCFRMFVDSDKELFGIQFCKSFISNQWSYKRYIIIWSIRNLTK